MNDPTIEETGAAMITAMLDDDRELASSILREIRLEDLGPLVIFLARQVNLTCRVGASVSDSTPLAIWSRVLELRRTGR